MEPFKSIVKAFNYYFGYYDLVYSWRRIKDKEGRLLVLTYHHLSDEPQSGTSKREWFELRPSVNKTEFESHLQVLKKRFKVVSLPDIVREKKVRGRLEDDCVAVTFDDGYESFYRLAFPLLKNYDLPATVFLPTDFINNQRMFWWDELLQIIFYAVPQDNSASALIPIMGEKLAKQFGEAGIDVKRKKEFLESSEVYLRNIEDGQREEKIENLKEILLPNGKVKKASLKTLSWEQIAEMSREGISFGSHTCSHLNLEFAPLDKVEEELSKSKEIIEKKLGTKVVCFAYPYAGDFETHLRVKPILNHLRYECACTCITGVNLANFDPFFLRRMTLPNTAFRPVIARELLLSYSGKFKEESLHARARSEHSHTHV